MCPGTPVADDEVGLSMTIIGSDQRSCRRPTCCTLSLPLAAGRVGSPHTPRLDPRRTHGTRAVGTGIPDGLISWGLESHTRGHAFGTPSLGTERRHVPDPALPSLECTALDDLQPTLCMICMSERSKSSYHLRSVIMLANTQQSAAALRITLCESVRFFFTYSAAVGHYAHMSVSSLKRKEEQLQPVGACVGHRQLEFGCSPDCTSTPTIHACTRALSDMRRAQLCDAG